MKIRNLFLKLLPVSLLILLISCGEITAKYDAVGDGKILPGDRVGTVDFSMTRTEIVALMGSPDSIFYGGDSFQLADYPVDAYFYYEAYQTLNSEIIWKKSQFLTIILLWTTGLKRDLQKQIFNRLPESQIMGLPKTIGNI